MELRIKEIQEKRKMKNVELSRLTGVGSQQISYYHTGDRKPPLLTLEKIAKALDCEVVELLPVNPPFYHSYDESGNWQGIREK